MTLTAIFLSALLLEFAVPGLVVSGPSTLWFVVSFFKAAAVCSGKCIFAK